MSDTNPTSDARRMTSYEIKFKRLRKAAELAEHKLTILEDRDDLSGPAAIACNLLRDALRDVQ